jgi:hypothetical protein
LGEIINGTLTVVQSFFKSVLAKQVKKYEELKAK